MAYKDHVSELVNLSDEERNAYFADIDRAAKAIHAAFHPDKINYGAYGDTGCHLHFSVLANGNYIIQGWRMEDADALGQMTIPNYETCVEVPKAAMRALLVGA